MTCTWFSSPAGSQHSTAQHRSKRAIHHGMMPLCFNPQAGALLLCEVQQHTAGEACCMPTDALGPTRALVQGLDPHTNKVRQRLSSNTNTHTDVPCLRLCCLLQAYAIQLLDTLVNTHTHTRTCPVLAAQLILLLPGCSRGQQGADNGLLNRLSNLQDRQGSTAPPQTHTRSVIFGDWGLPAYLLSACASCLCIPCVNIQRQVDLPPPCCQAGTTVTPGRPAHATQCSQMPHPLPPCLTCGLAPQSTHHLCCRLLAALLYQAH